MRKPASDHIDTVIETEERTLRTHSAEKVSTSLSEKSPSRTRWRKLTRSAAVGQSRRVESRRSAQCRSHCRQAESWPSEVDVAQLWSRIWSTAASSQPRAARFRRRAARRASVRGSSGEPSSCGGDAARGRASCTAARIEPGEHGESSVYRQLIAADELNAETTGAVCAARSTPAPLTGNARRAGEESTAPRASRRRSVATRERPTG